MTVRQAPRPQVPRFGAETSPAEVVGATVMGTTASHRGGVHVGRLGAGVLPPARRLVEPGMVLAGVPMGGAPRFPSRGFLQLFGGQDG